jgi:hypothetical protein
MWFFIGIVITFCWIWIACAISKAMGRKYTEEIETHIIVNGNVDELKELININLN